MGAKVQTPRERLLTRWGQLKQERASWVPHWKEISDNLLPRSGRFFLEDRNRGERRHNTIYDSTGTGALRILAAGMMSNMTSPARPWFRLTTTNPQLNEADDVKVWLAEVTRLMQMVFNRSNTYRALHSSYEELGAFGTAATIILPDMDATIHHHVLTVGEYAIATDHQGKVDTLYREFQMTVGQMVKEFGHDKVSPTVQSLFDRGTLDQWVTVLHCIEPRSDRDLSKRDNKNMPFKSIYMEMGSKDHGFLRESGFKRFPALCPRWAVSGGDIYGNSPGMEGLGDVKQLQHEQLRKAQGIDYKTNPPLQAPTSLSNRPVDTLPGGVTFVDASTPHGGLRTAFDVNLDLSHLLNDIQDVRQRIRTVFYADLFLMMANDQRSGITATEVAERHEEKMLMLGPVVERLQNEILDPLIELTYAAMEEQGQIPPLPESLKGVVINVEFVSALAQAQRSVATNSVDRFVGSLGQVAQFKPEVLDKLDADQWVDQYGDMLGIDPTLIVPDAKVLEIRTARAKVQARQMQSAEKVQQASATRDMAAADTSGQNALTDATSAFTGYT
jgi:hypothetical protein